MMGNLFERHCSRSRLIFQVRVKAAEASNCASSLYNGLRQAIVWVTRESLAKRNESVTMKPVALITTLLFLTTWIAAFYWWHQSVPLVFDPRMPNEANDRGLVIVEVDLKGTHQSFPQEDRPRGSDIQGMWPWFRGSNYDAIWTETVDLAESWPETGPPVVWELPLGSGYAGPAVFGDRMYIMDYDEDEQSDALRCFFMEDAKEMWRHSYKIPIKRYHGISRTVAATDGKNVVGLGPKCHVICCDAKTGDFKWGIDLVNQYGTKVPEWYAGQCPIIVDGNVILAPAGKDVLLMAVNCESGETVWSVPNPKGWRMSHSSIVPMTINGKRTYVYFAQGGAVGISTDGKLLWETNLWNYSVVAPSPVQTGPDRMVITSGYGAGSMEIIITDGKATAGKVWKKNEFACEQQTPVLYKGHLYSVMPKDAGDKRQRLVCMSVDGTIRWYSDDNKFGLGPFMIANGKIFLLSDSGVLTMAAVSSSGYRKLAQVDVLEGHDAWGPMAVVDGHLIVRDMKTMKCLDLRKPSK
jgi:outer membrane protein assembly factor BamB